VNASKRCIHKEVPEQLMIAIANAVVYKWAVVVHPKHTLIAHFTVVSPWWFNFLAFIAESEL